MALTAYPGGQGQELKKEKKSFFTVTKEKNESVGTTPG